jgi:hypothetical protein
VQDIRRAMRRLKIRTEVVVTAMMRCWSGVTPYSSKGVGTHSKPILKGV